MLEMMYKTDVYIGVLLSDPPFLQKSRIQGSKNLNWRKRLRLRPRETYVYHPIRNAMLGLWFFPSEIGSKEPRKLDFSSGRSRTSSFTFSKNWNFTKFLVIFWRIFCRRLDTPCHSPMKFEWQIAIPSHYHVLKFYPNRFTHVRAIARTVKQEKRDFERLRQFADVYANSPFSNPEFWISGQMVGQRVKPLYRHQFYIWFEAFWAKKIFLLYQSLFLPNGTTLFLSNDFDSNSEFHTNSTLQRSV